MERSVAYYQTQKGKEQKRKLNKRRHLLLESSAQSEESLHKKTEFGIENPISPKDQNASHEQVVDISLKDLNSEPPIISQTNSSKLSPQLTVSDTTMTEEEPPKITINMNDDPLGHLNNVAASDSSQNVFSNEEIPHLFHPAEILKNSDQPEAPNMTASNASKKLSGNEEVQPQLSDSPEIVKNEFAPNEIELSISNETVTYLKSIISLIEGRMVSGKEILNLLSKKVRQLRMVKQKKIEYAIEYLMNHPP